MELRNELAVHKEDLWVLGLPKQGTKHPLPPMADLIDWYNNHVLIKSIISKRVSFEWGSKTLIPTGGAMPAHKLLIVGLGEVDGLTPANARKFLQDLSQVIDDIGASQPWIVLPPEISKSFFDEIRKSRTSHKNLSHANIFSG